MVGGICGIVDHLDGINGVKGRGRGGLPCPSFLLGGGADAPRGSGRGQTGEHLQRRWPAGDNNVVRDGIGDDVVVSSAESVREISVASVGGVIMTKDVVVYFYEDSTTKVVVVFIS